jgi:hypothetical protein
MSVENINLLIQIQLNLFRKSWAIQQMGLLVQKLIDYYK